jgi:hypothetical protein
VTNPTLSIDTTKQIGRLYQLPGGSYAKKISSQKAKAGIADGTLFPSITNVLSVMNKNLEGYHLYMAQKAFRAGQDISEAIKAGDMWRDYASARGSAVHLLIEQYIDAGNGKRGSFLPAYRSLAGWEDVKAHDAHGYMNAFISFCNTYQPVFHQQETTVYGSTGGLGSTVIPDNVEPSLFDYAGTTDFIATINGVRVVGDWKCTSRLSPSVARQVAAVRNASHFYDPATESLREWDSLGLEQAIAVRLCADGTFEIKAADLQAGWDSFKTLRSEWDNYALGDDFMLTEWTP